MSAPPPKPSTAPVADNEVELQAQPIDLAHKSASSSSTTSATPPVTARVIGDASKPIFLVKPSGSPGPVIAGTSLALPAQPPGHATATVVQTTQVPVAVTVPIPITVARLPAAIRPGTTVTRVVSTTLATTAGSYTGGPSHVPKGPAAVANISLPRSAVASAVIRPAPSASPGISQVTGFPVNNRTPRPATVSARPAGVEVGASAAAPLSGTWVTVTPASAVVQQPQQVSTIYKAATNTAGAGAMKSTTNLILTGGQKATPVLTPAPNASSISVVGQQKTSTPSAASNITLLSVTRGSPGPAVVTTRAAGTPTGAVTLGPRPGPEVIKATPALLQTAQRTSSMTITSTTAVQGGEKQLGKSATGAALASSTSVSGAALVRPTAGAAGQVQIAARTVASAITSASPVITANSGVTPVVFTGGIKNVTTVGKVGQQGIAVQFPQMSVSAVAAKVANPHAPAVAGSRPANAGTVPIANVSTTGAIANSRTFLVTTQPASSIPVAKVLPQSATSSSGTTTIRETGGPPPSEVHVITNSAAAATNPQTIYSHTPARGGNDGQANPIVHPAVTQSSTPSKLMGTSPRPSILRKRDYEGVPLKAQKNLTASLGVPGATTSTPSSNTTAIPIPTTPAISPPSPRRIDLTPGGPNGDSSRSSSGGSTTLSASSSPGIPADLDETNQQTSIASSVASAALGKALAGIVKQEPLDGVETNATVLSARVVTSVSQVISQPEIMMSPRKKPRKQQLLGQELQEVRSSDDEMPPTISIKETKSDVLVKVEPKESAPPVVRRPRVSLMSSYRQTWKARNHHFVRYSDVKLKDERRPTVTDLANQKHILQKVHGWKVYHLTAQIEEMAHSEQQVHERLSAVLSVMEKLGGKAGDRDLMRVNELIKGNLQRSKVIRDGLEDSKLQVQKIFDHKPRAEEIIQRYMYKRLAKKREK